MKDNELLAAMLAAAMLNESKEKGTQEKEKKSLREHAKELGELMKETMLGLIDAGFTKEEAFEIALMIKGGK